MNDPISNNSDNIPGDDVDNKDLVATTVNNTSFNPGVPVTQATTTSGPTSQATTTPTCTTYPAVAHTTTAIGAKKSLSSNIINSRPLSGWGAPPGRGLRGGAPGETSAMSNGTTGWGPPPASNPGNAVGWGGGGGGGGPGPSQSAAAAWGSSPAANSTNSGKLGFFY